LNNSVTVWEDFSNGGVMTKEIFLALKTSMPPQLGYVGSFNEAGEREGHGTYAEKIGKIYQLYEVIMYDSLWVESTACTDDDCFSLL
jgi:hypothetical protein